MTAEPLTHEEMIDIFWHSNAPSILAHEWSIARIIVARNHPFLPVTVKPQPFDLSAVKLETEQVEYYLEGQEFGSELWVAVMCNRRIIVPPFPLRDRPQIPNMYRKESRIAATSGTAARLDT